MAPIIDETVDALRELVHKLESRVQQLEAKLEQADGAPVRSTATLLTGRYFCHRNVRHRRFLEQPRFPNDFHARLANV